MKISFMNNMPNHTNSVVVQLLGGLGNQMFQYAAGRSLSHRLGLPLFFDTTFLNRDPKRDYSLHHFSVRAEIADDQMLDYFHKKIEKRRDSDVIEIVKNKLLPRHYRTIITHQHFSYDDSFEKVGSGCYMKGYWQSEKYFKQIESLISNELRLDFPASYSLQENMISSIANTESVSVHIRRGDYADDTGIKRVHRTLPEQYYRNAIAYIQSKIGNPQYFIFSDDIEWVKNSMDFPDSVRFVHHSNPNADIKDFTSMRQCKHHIIANSTFSWWSAWLSANPSKTVIAPRQWFTTDEMKKRDMEDLIPLAWVKL